MSRQTENLIKDFKKFVEEKGEPRDNSELDELFDEFMAQYGSMPPSEITEKTAKTSDDFLTLAESAKDEKSALKYAKKALELDPDNIDAAIIAAESSFLSFDKNIEKYKKLIESAEKKLEAEGYFNDDCMGEFWLIAETRPFMRLLDRYADCLIKCEKMRLAIETYEKMLRLCENDNMGARYRLMHLYVLFEDERSALRLFEKYPEENRVMFLLPLSILYYKLGNLSKAESYLKKMSAVNKDTRKFLKSVTDGNLDKYFDIDDSFGYEPFTFDEYLEETRENYFLFAQSTAYFEWALKKLKTAKK